MLPNRSGRVGQQRFAGAHPRHPRLPLQPLLGAQRRRQPQQQIAAVFATQQALAGNEYTAAGATVVAGTALAVDYLIGLESIPWSEDDLKKAADRLGSGLEDAADSVSDKVDGNNQ